MLVKTIDYSCIHYVWPKYSNTTISRKLVHSTVKITVLSQESLNPGLRPGTVMIRKREQLAKLPDQLSKHFVRNKIIQP